MTVSIAGFEILRFGGRMTTPFLRQTSETVTGLDGQTRILDAWACRDASINTVMAFETKEDATARKLDLMKLMTTKVSVMDPLEEQWDEVYVVEVHPYISGKADGTWEVIADWILSPQAKAPEGFEENIE